jgi:hypothetical protein
MKAILILALLLAGCSVSRMDPEPALSQQAQCEQQRGGGVWNSTLGICAGQSGGGGGGGGGGM